MSDCLFCKFVSGEYPCHKVWEDEKHLAFLTIFPNTDGVTVVIPKHHYPSYAFDLPKNIFHDLVDAAALVGKKIDAAFDDVGRTGMVFEGFGINHVHAKLYPLHGTNKPEWAPHNSDTKVFFDEYQGYISSHDGEKADDAHLAEIAARIREA